MTHKARLRMNNADYKSGFIRAALAGLIHEMSLLTAAARGRLWVCAE